MNVAQYLHDGGALTQQSHDYSTLLSMVGTKGAELVLLAQACDDNVHLSFPDYSVADTALSRDIYSEHGDLENTDFSEYPAADEGGAGNLELANAFEAAILELRTAATRESVYTAIRSSLLWPSSSVAPPGIDVSGMLFSESTWKQYAATFVSRLTGSYQTLCRRMLTVTPAEYGFTSIFLTERVPDIAWKGAAYIRAGELSLEIAPSHGRMPSRTSYKVSDTRKMIGAPLAQILHRELISLELEPQGDSVTEIEFVASLERVTVLQRRRLPGASRWREAGKDWKPQGALVDTRRLDSKRAVEALDAGDLSDATVVVSQSSSQCFDLFNLMWAESVSSIGQIGELYVVEPLSARFGMRNHINWTALQLLDIRQLTLGGPNVEGES